MSKLFQVYKITNDYDDLFYVGCTYQTLKRRMQHHLSDARCRHYIKADRKLLQHIRLVGEDRFYIELIDQRMCNVSLREHNEFEQEYIGKYNPPLNSMRAFGRNFDHYKITHAQCKTARRKRNADIQCICGSKTQDKTRHLKTKKHLNFMENSTS